MPGPQVVFTVDAKHSAALRAWMQVQSAIEGAGGAAGRLGDNLNNAGNKSDATFGRILGNIGKTVAGFAGVGSALMAIQTAASQILKEYEHAKSRLSDTGMNAMEAAPALRQAAIAYGQVYPKGDQSFPELEKFVREKVVARGVSEGSAFTALAGVLSAGAGVIDPKRLADSLELSAQVLGPSAQPDDLNSLADAIVGRMKTNQGLTATQALGQILPAYRTAAAGNIAEYAKHAEGAIATGERLGLPTDQSAALFSMLGHASNDKTGRTSYTAQTNMLTWLKELQSGISKDPMFKHVGPEQMTFEKFFEYVRTSKDKPASLIRGMAIGDFYTGEGHFGKGDAGRTRASQEVMMRRMIAQDMYGSSITEMPGEAKSMLGQLGLFDVTGSMIDAKTGLTPQVMFDQFVKQQPKGRSQLDAITREFMSGLKTLPGLRAEETSGLLSGAARNIMGGRPAEAIKGMFLQELERIQKQTGSTSLMTTLEGVKQMAIAPESTVTEAQEHIAKWARERAVLLRQDSKTRYGGEGREDHIKKEDHERSAIILEEMAKAIKGDQLQAERRARAEGFRDASRVPQAFFTPPNTRRLKAWTHEDSWFGSNKWFTEGTERFNNEFPLMPGEQWIQQQLGPVDERKLRSNTKPAPGLGDQSSLKREIGELRSSLSETVDALKSLANRMGRHQIEVTIDDPYGRQLGRAVGIPREFEQLSDSGQVIG